MRGLDKLPEMRVLLVILTAIAGIFLWRLVWGFLVIFSDIALILILSWLLAFILEPLVKKLTSKGLSRLAAAGLVYCGLAVIMVIGGMIVVPVIVTQLTSLAGTLPVLFLQAPEWADRAQIFLTNTLTNSVAMVSSLASAMVNFVLILIISFYFLVERAAISKFILDIIPDSFKEDWRFLERVINTSFAGFLQTQVVLGILVGVATFFILLILKVNYVLSAAVATGILAVIPVVGPILAIVPPLLPAFLASFNTGVITTVVLVLMWQIIYNVVAPKLLGKALKIHPLVVLLSFIIGYKIGGVWGAVFAVPVVSAAVVIAREFLTHWRKTS